jgi:glycosyltransferase involved in cell wall biosynthesis
MKSGVMVTVVYPLYASEPYLPRMFQALAEQTFKDFSCIFVYDKSPDDTLSKLNEELRLHPEIDGLVLEKPVREGLGKARDFAMDSGLIKGKYVIFVDADDYPHPDFLEKLVSKAEKDQADITMCGFHRVDQATGKIIDTEMVHNPDKIQNPGESRVAPYLNPATWNKLMRYEAIKSLRYIYTGGVAEDTMFLLKALPLCHVVSFVNEPLYEYYVHSGSLAEGFSYEAYEKSQKAFIDVREWYKADPAHYEKCLPLLETFMFIRLGLGMTTRIALKDHGSKKKVIKETRTFLYKEFPGWSKNPYLGFWKSLRLGFKALMLWRCKVLYQLNIFGLFVFDFKIYSGVFHKNIRW